MSGDPLINGNADLFVRVISILETARTNVVRSVNSEMVAAYWLIGREIVEEVQAGGKRAGYAGELIDQLSSQLNHRFGKGFSATNLKTIPVVLSCFPRKGSVFWHSSCRIRHTLCDEFGRIYAIAWLVALSGANEGRASGGAGIL
ncbi:hypothetical protein SCARR_02417 [Pontiella sulfatireligans]|uniref:YhcG N-terminal domain-containing protein n=1 Tax=Pontiella sulfatireligans TaxID=2750658 RepID=A0A6C2UM23_9BACT|nr:hypothetical protein SCARR_02417 [Pontiella sulfatireligans]